MSVYDRLLSGNRLRVTNRNTTSAASSVFSTTQLVKYFGWIAQAAQYTAKAPQIICR